MSSNRHRRQGGTTPTTEPKNSPAVAQFSVSEVAQFSVSLDMDPVRHQALAVGNLRKALCMGGVFAVSTVLPEKIQHLAAHLEDIRRFAPDEVLEHSLQVLGCFLVLSVLIWASKSEPQPVRPLLAYPPHNRETALVHVAGLVVGVVLMLW